MAIGWGLCLACINEKCVAGLVTLNLGSGLGVRADLTAQDHICAHGYSDESHGPSMAKFRKEARWRPKRRNGLPRRLRDICEFEQQR